MAGMIQSCFRAASSSSSSSADPEQQQPSNNNKPPRRTSSSGGMTISKSFSSSFGWGTLKTGNKNRRSSRSDADGGNSGDGGSDKDEKWEISCVRPGYLYLSGCSDLTRKRLAPLGITAVINCIRGVTQKFDDDIQYHYLPLEDEEKQDLRPYFALVFNIIDAVRSLGGRVLIYCGMGISRSATFCIGYVMQREGLSLIDAYRSVQTRRSCVCPNVGFFRQLIELERSQFPNRDPTVKIIEPTPGILVPDVVWNELYQEVMSKLPNSK